MSLISKEAFVDLSASTFIMFFVPAIFIFALVFGVLSRLKIIDDVKMEVLISLIIGLLAAQFEFVQCVFLDVLPRFVIVMVLIFAFWVIAGLFLGERKKGVNYIAIGALVLGFVFVFATTTCPFNWSLGAWFFDNWPYLLGALVILGLLIAILRQGEPADYPKAKHPKSEGSDEGRLEPADYDKVKQPYSEESSPRTKKSKKEEESEKRSKDKKPTLTVKTVPSRCTVELSEVGTKNSGILGRVKFKDLKIGNYHLEVYREGYIGLVYRIYIDRNRKVVARLEKEEGEVELKEFENETSPRRKGPGMRINLLDGVDVKRVNDSESEEEFSEEVDETDEEDYEIPAGEYPFSPPSGRERKLLPGLPERKLFPQREEPKQITSETPELRLRDSQEVERYQKRITNESRLLGYGTREGRTQPNQNIDRSQRKLTSDPYEILGIDRDTLKSDAKSAFWKKARENHPDYGGDVNKFRRISEAWQDIKARKGWS